MKTTIQPTETSAKGHTPGPWRVKSTNRSASLEIIGGEHYHHVCALDGKRTESHFHAQESNARLIASAPDLIFELQRLVTLIRNQDVTITRPNYDIETFLASAVEVITQAKGTK